MNCHSRLQLSPHGLLSTGTLVLGVLATTTPALARQQTLVEMRDFSPHEVRLAGFSLDRPQQLHLEVTGADDHLSRTHRILGIPVGIQHNERGYWRGDAWILDARTRQVAWDLRSADTDRDSDGMRRFRGDIELPAGDYEVYFASYSATGATTDGQAVIAASRGRRPVMHYHDNGEAKQFRLSLRGPGHRLDATTLARDRAAFDASAFVRLRDVPEDGVRRTGFVLPRSTTIEIYAIGEVMGDDAYDYGWILNADTHEPVWTLREDNSDPAGGAQKNRMVRRRIELPAGRYVAAFAADDSHDPTDWNATPPYDPDYWGLTLRVADPTLRAAIGSFDWDPVPAHAIVALTRVGDDQAREAGFILSHPMDLRVHALGEGFSSGMDDYGWIVDATTHRTVWTMAYDDTRPAGGAAKNRVFDDIVHLPAGRYVTYYATDDSHAFGDWNAAPPMNRELWGITVTTADGSPAGSAAQPYDERDDPSVLARLVLMRDNENARARLDLPQATDIRIYALGEGSDGDMYDYAWIEDTNTGRAVWEMTYRSTQEAGGAEKNRLFDGVIHLPAGLYVLHYQSDDSHSFGDWNAAPPTDPAHWGVTVYRTHT